jgi:hypothetical protein
VRFLDTLNVSGVLSVAKYVSFAQLNENNTSIATDGEYLYLYVSIMAKPMMYKIGSGASPKTIPGKVYLSRRGDKDGEICWVYCKGKLYFKRADDDLGVLTVYDAETLGLVGEVKLISEEIFNQPVCQRTNRLCPLLTDGDNLFIITIRIEEKLKEIRPNA